MNRIYTIVILFIIAMPGTSRSQYTIFGERNFRQLDSVEDIIKNIFCKDTLTYSAKYDNGKMKEDLWIVSVLNDVFDSSFTADKIGTEFKRNRKVTVAREKWRNGLIKVHRIVMNGAYLHAVCKLESIGNIIIRKKCEINTNTYVRCGKNGDRYLDFNLLKNQIAGRLHFSIRVRDYELLVATELLERNIVKASEQYKDYRFLLPSGYSKTGENQVSRILNKQYDADSSCCYSFSKAPDEFIFLIRNGEFGVINNLLYSPNYAYSINAMEALIYLAGANKIGLDHDIKKRMDFLKTSNSEFHVQHSDVLYIKNGYKDVQVSNEQIVKKYQRAMN